MISEKYIQESRMLIHEADAILIGAGSGLSSAAGLSYGGKRFSDNFADYIAKYKLTDMYSSAFYPWPTLEEKWGYFSRHIKMNRFDFEVTKPYKDLLELVKNKEHFVLTTNADALFEKAGFDTSRIFATQGDYTKFQCALACSDTLYDNKQMVFDMVEQQQDCRIPLELLPICPNCGGELVPHLRINGYFVENDDWHAASKRYRNFVRNSAHKKLVLLELGVGFNTPSIIRWPFEQLSAKYAKSSFIRVNMDNVESSYPVSGNSVLLKADIAEFVDALLY